MLQNIPSDAAMLLDHLRSAGFSAYLVGGCIRDAILGLIPHDWDICTAASPQQMQQVFSGFHTIETGLKHGTLTVMAHHEPYEITTFRTDGEYTDHRHPDGVTFVTDVKEDLARRDFTVNAMAWNPADGLVDPFGGREDLKAGIVRCVGDPEKRFTEDALRILRALRFSSTYDFPIEPATASAALKLSPTLTLVAPERIRVELDKLLCGKAAGRVLREYAEILAVILPEIRPMFGFEQHTPWHRYDVWEHTVRAVESIQPDKVLRLAMLLHDSGKPSTFTFDEEGIGHAYGHQNVSAAITQAVTDRLRFDQASAKAVHTLVLHHDIDIDDSPRLLRRRLNQFGEEAFRQLLLVQRADAMAKGTEPPEVTEARSRQLFSALEALLAQQPCVSLKDLAVNGRDLMALGFSGRGVGEQLQALLNAVMDEQLPNDRDALLTAARSALP